MKKIGIIIVISLISIFVNGQNIKQYMYCEVVGISYYLSTKAKISINYGRNSTFGEVERVRAKDGELIKFNTMIDAINWMARDGWQLDKTYVVAHESTNVYHWVLKLDVTNLSDEEIERITGQSKNM